MNKDIKFEFTKEMLYEKVVNAMQKEPEGLTNKTAKPNLLELVKSKTGLNKVRNERI